MTARQVASLFIKLVACYVAIRAIPSFLTAAQTALSLRNSEFPVAYPLAIAMGSLVGVLVLLYLLVSRSDWFATRLVKNDTQDVSIAALTTIDIQAVAFSWVGLLLMANAISGLVYQLTLFRRMSHMEGAQSALVTFGDRIYSGIASETSQFLLGIVLFLFPRGLSQLWHRIQRTRPMKS